MIKGFIFFNEKRIPYVIENYRMELFTDDEVLSSFTKQYNFKYNYILKGLYFREGFQGEKAEFLVEHSFGSTCYLKCFIIYAISNAEKYDAIGFQSPFLDGVFRYEHQYLDLVRAGKNLEIEPIELYRIPFTMDCEQYELVYRIGHDNRLGLLEDHNRKGEFYLTPKKNQIQECYNLTVVLHRLAMFTTSYAEVPFKRVILYHNGISAGWFYCPLISDNETSIVAPFFSARFMEFDVEEYIPRILNNIAKDSGNKITNSIPLGHLANGDLSYSPQRFMEQIMAFEYLYDKLDHSHAQNTGYPLKRELEQMFNEYPQLLSNSRLSSGDASERIKETRRIIAHGYAYYYEFEQGTELPYLMIILDKLLEYMSLQWIGFNNTEISDYPIY